MAIAFARARYISRSNGGDAVRSSAYNARAALTAERTGELFYFKHRDAPAHHEILLPDGADERFRDGGVLWNAAEMAEHRKNSQVAREIVLALPVDAGLTDADRIELARSFAQEHFVAKGLAVQLDVHAPHESADGEEEAAPVNFHAHLLITTRRLDGEMFSAKKARDLAPEMRACAAHLFGVVVKRSFVVDAEAWGDLWREHQDRYFIEQGFSIRVDAQAIHPGAHIGPVRMRKPGSDLVARAEVLRQDNEEAARDPAQVLMALTRDNATFSERDLDRFLGKHLDDEEERALVRRAVLGHFDAVALHDPRSLEPVGRWTTRDVRAQEVSALADGAALANGSYHKGVGYALARRTAGSYSLRADQRAAFEHTLTWGGLKIIEGRAGTGKSYTLQAVRAAHELAGFEVIGLGPTNAVAQDLAADGFANASTAHSELFKLKNGRAAWNADTVIVVDEAAMLDSAITGALLAAAKAAGAKVILSGDDRQLASIERGGLFEALKARHGSAEIVEVTRQRDAWQRQASRDLADGRFAAAVLAYDRHGAIRWMTTQDEARAALVNAWRKDAAHDPKSSRFVFAYTNADVDALNADLREVFRAQGGLSGSDVEFETRHGMRSFAVGDRVQLTDTDKRAGLYNGNAGTITAIDAGTGRISARLDAAAGREGRAVSWSASAFDGFRHGYAGTIYKGQGRTLDRTYVYHTHHWRSAASYVALTRQRESAQIFVATETARDARDLARQMARGEVKAASVAWLTAEEAVAAEIAREAERAAAAKEKQRREEEVAAATAKSVAAEIAREAERIARAARERRLAQVLAQSRAEIAASVAARETSHDRTLRAVDGYAKALMDAKRIRDMGLPIPELQLNALNDARDALDAAQPGAGDALLSAARQDPAVRRAMTELEGPERAAQLLAGMDRARQTRDEERRAAAAAEAAAREKREAEAREMEAATAAAWRREQQAEAARKELADQTRVKRLEAEALSLEAKRQAPSDPNVQAERLVARWKEIEQERDKLDPWKRYLEHKEAYEKSDALRSDLIGEIGTDAQMDCVLWARRQEFGFGERSPLGEALRETAAVRALEGDLEDQPRPSPSPGP